MKVLDHALRQLTNVCGLLLVLCLAVSADAQSPAPGKNLVTIRGQQQKVYFLPAEGQNRHRKILFAPGKASNAGGVVVTLLKPRFFASFFHSSL